MSNVLLGVTGSVAAVKVPELANLIRAAGHDLKVVTTASGLYFFDPVELDPSRVVRNPELVTTDADEWPGKDEGERYRRGDEVRHIELRRWADIFLVAPLDANTMGKFANGICDNCLTCVWRAWDSAKPVVLAPAMNTHMWDHPMTRRHLRCIAMDFGASHVPGLMEDDALIAQLNARGRNFRIVPPVTKRLACGDTGVGAMADTTTILANLSEMLASPSGTP
ncbi:flavoprotein [Zavarzinella formosa]|uniref:flavoprotein n=1 Tax=Zavarzinella formosa TaxID=360055 RepID=UPI0003679A8F|nr:flavoprotein [Zavarzinella formosa]